MSVGLNLLIEVVGPRLFLENLTPVPRHPPPFQLAPRDHPASRGASSALGLGTALAPAIMMCSRTTSRLSPDVLEKDYSLSSITFPYASRTTLEGSVFVKDMALCPELSTVALSVGMPTISPLPSPVGRLDQNLLHKIITPYSASAFDQELLHYGLTKQFPDLVRHLQLGFPISKDSFHFSKTEVPPNHFSCAGYDNFLDAFLDDEASLGHMSGPFSRGEIEAILGEPFVTTPLLLVIEKWGMGEPEKIWVCRNSLKTYSDGKSVNDHINSDDFATVWTTAAAVADIVRVSFTLLW